MIKWSTEDNQLTRVFQFDTYMEGIQFVHQVAEFAEIQNHHPLIEVDYQKVTVNLTSHEEGTVTTKDKQLAILIDNAYEKGVR